MKRILLVLLFGGLLSGGLRAQNITDGLMMPKNTFCTGFMTGQDKWTNYWQGQHERDNMSIGHFVSRNITWMGTYGISKKVNVIAMLPYIKNQLIGGSGTLHEQHGVQDLTIAVKYHFFTKQFDSTSAFKAFAGVAYSNPMTDYTPDFLPLSIGTASKRVAWRLNLNFTKGHWYTTASAAYTWRSNITLDTDSHETDGGLVYSHEAKIPNIFDVYAAIGYHKQALQVEANFSQMNSLGGDDIYRQAMPVAWDKMNATRIGGLVMYYLPWPKYLAARGTVNYTVAGRNVGRTTSFGVGLMYTIFFTKDKELKGLNK